ncbi:MAG: tRNA 2-thiouridine(34) synthase MnmA [Chloroflexi bacterium]|nr:tRNA 2-thiouridine(34) synthase MnmA [Chloroflexota bacterium]
MPKVFVAMSGGVDSSVAACLLKRDGHEVVGLHMHLWCEDRQGAGAQRRQCCNIEDARDAEHVCQKLDIPFYQVNFRDEFQSRVVDYFCNEYAGGRTPNPCLACNRHLKFGLLLERVRALGGDYLATGHYARVRAEAGSQVLLQGVDPAKDQSYFLYMLGQNELRSIIFPVGGLRKTEVRRIAAEAGLPVAQKADSVEVCFVSGDYRNFLEQRARQIPGDIVDQDGRVLGRHRGLAGYTVGQRARLAEGSGQKLYVAGLDTDRNRLVVAGEDTLSSQGLVADDMCWVACEPPAQGTQCTVQVRYRSPGTKCVLNLSGGAAEVVFAEPQRAVAPGQAAVFYDGEKVLGGGTIRSSLKKAGVPGSLVTA